MFMLEFLFINMFVAHEGFIVILNVGEIVCELPNNRLEKFQGNLMWRTEKYALDNSNIVLRVCRALLCLGRIANKMVLE